MTFRRRRPVNQMVHRTLSLDFFTRAYNEAFPEKEIEIKKQKIF